MCNRKTWYRCGWCGWPCDENGLSLNITIEDANKLCEENADSEPELVNGSCCPGGDMEDEYADIRRREYIE